MNEPIRYNITDAALAELKTKFATVPDANTTDGYEIIRNGIGEIRTLNGDLERKRKELKADSLDYGRRIDSEAKRIALVFAEIVEPLKAAKKIVDDEKEAIKQEKIKAEEDRRIEIIASIDRIRSQSLNVVGKTSTEILEILSSVRQIDTKKYPEGYQAIAESAKADTTATILDALESIKTQEAEAAEAKEKAKIENERLEKKRIENERIRKELEEKERIAETKRIEEQGRIDAENYRIRKEKEALEQKERESQSKIKAEEDRIEKEKLEIRLKQEAKEQAEKDAKKKADREAEAKRREEKKKADDESYQAEIASSATHDIWIVTQDQGMASKLFDVIKSGKVRHVRIDLA